MSRSTARRQSFYAMRRLVRQRQRWAWWSWGGIDPADLVPAGFFEQLRQKMERWPTAQESTAVEPDPLL